MHFGPYIILIVLHCCWAGVTKEFPLQGINKVVIYLSIYLSIYLIYDKE